MAHEEIQAEASVSSADTASGANESPDRRSFLKGTFTVAAATAAGGLAASASATEPTQSKQQPEAAGPKLSGSVHAQFSSQNRPNLEDLNAAIRQIVGRAGCPTCGLGGIDLRMTIVDPIEIQSRVPVTVVAGRAAGG
jgi:hypothetical protein